MTPRMQAWHRKVLELQDQIAASARELLRDKPVGTAGLLPVRLRPVRFGHIGKAMSMVDVFEGVDRLLVIKGTDGLYYRIDDPLFYGRKGRQTPKLRVLSRRT